MVRADFKMCHDNQKLASKVSTGDAELIPVEPQESLRRRLASFTLCVWAYVSSSRAWVPLTQQG